MPHTTVIEISGVKLEVDLRTAIRIDQLRIGDRVKVLVKTYSDYRIYPGTIVGFEPFEKLPTIIIAYLEVDYSGANVKFVHFNANTKDTEVVKAIDDDILEIDKPVALAGFDREIEKKRAELQDLEAKRAYFLANFQAYWPQFAPIEPPQ